MEYYILLYTILPFNFGILSSLGVGWVGQLIRPLQRLALQLLFSALRL
jgi:hypothetical protein